MTAKELKRMGRRELLEILVEMKKNEQELKNRLEEAERKLDERNIQIADSDSIAEAALSLNRVFEAAQAAANTYLQMIRSGDPSKECETQEELLLP